MWDILHFLLSEFSENSTYGISTHILFHFHITEIKNTKPHKKITKNLSAIFSVIFPFYSKNPHSIQPKIPLTNHKTNHQHRQISHKSTVFSESNHFLIIMHLFSHPFLPNQTLSILNLHLSTYIINPII